MGISAAHKAIFGSLLAKSELEIKGARITTRTEIATTMTNLTRKEAFIYSLAFSSSPFARLSEIKLTDPEDIPISAKDERMITKLRTAEKIPKSATDMARATKSLYRKPQKAERLLPANKIKVSLAVAEKARDLTW